MRPCEDLWGTCLCAKSGFPIPLPKTDLDMFFLSLHAFGEKNLSYDEIRIISVCSRERIRFSSREI